MAHSSKRLNRRQIAAAIMARNSEQIRADRRTGAHVEVVVTVDDDRITTVWGVGEELECEAYKAGVMVVGKRASHPVVMVSRYHSHGPSAECRCVTDDGPSVWRNAVAAEFDDAALAAITAL